MNTKELFNEFLELYYVPDDKPIFKLKDILVGPGLILRILNKTYILYYLTSGTQIIIPWKYIDLFSALNTWGGDRILRSKQDDNVDRLIFHFLNLIIAAETKNGDLLLESIVNISEIGTEKLIEAYEKLNLEQIEVRTPNKILEI